MIGLLGVIYMASLFIRLENCPYAENNSQDSQAEYLTNVVLINPLDEDSISFLDEPVIWNYTL